MRRARKTRRGRRGLVALAVVVLLAAALALRGNVPAPAPPEGLEPAGESTVTEVVDGDTFVLADGRDVRLVGIQAPKLALGRPNFREWPLADEAKRALEEMTLGRQVRLLTDGRAMDRHGRVLAHAIVGDTWVQGALIADGMARVYGFSDNRTALPALLALEREARADARGIWALDWYRVLTPEESHGLIGTFQIVEGRVLAVGQGGSRTYLNFGEDWRTDFTVAILDRDLGEFRAAGVEPRDLEGVRMRVRGWLRSINGPMIDATHPEQIEVLGP